MTEGENKKYGDAVQSLSAAIVRMLAAAPESKDEIGVAIGALVETLCPIVVSTMPTMDAEPFIQRAVALWFEACRNAADRHFFETQEWPKGRTQ